MTVHAPAPDTLRLNMDPDGGGVGHLLNHTLLHQCKTVNTQAEHGSLSLSFIMLLLF